MFKCDLCKKLSEPGQKQRRIVAEHRNKIYYNHKNEAIGEGSEIVKEVVVCDVCGGEKDAA